MANHSPWGVCQHLVSCQMHSHFELQHLMCQNSNSWFDLITEKQMLQKDMAQHCLQEQIFALLLWLLICSSKQRLLIYSSVGGICTPFTSNVMSHSCAYMKTGNTQINHKLKEFQSIHSYFLSVPYTKSISALRVKYFEPAIWQTKYSYSTRACGQNKGIYISVLASL